MPKFGWCKFAEDKFGNRTRYNDYKYKMLGGIPLGMEVRRTVGKRAGDISKAVTFRVRRGNGSWGGVLGKKYQDKYKYTAAMAAVNTGLTVNKTKFASAVSYWQNTLTDGAKKEYHKRAIKRLCMSGYNLFISEVMKGKFTI